MKSLFSSFKKCNKIQKILFLSSVVLYIGLFIFFLINLLKLKHIETALRVVAIVICSLWFLLYSLGGLLALVLKRNKTFTALTIINSLLLVIFLIASFFINSFMKNIYGLNKEYILYTTNLIALNDTTLNEDSKLGMISNTDDIEGNVLAKRLIKKENLDYEIVEYDDYFQMVYDMYEGEIDGLFVSSNFAVTFSAQERYENIKDEVKVLYEYSEELLNQDQIKTTKKLTEPFTMLIMGVDSENDGLNANQAFNGDTLILITFNPNTLTATMFSIPRDMYVPIACRGNTYDKINSSAAYGSTCVMDTITQMTDIEIDYYLKINFKGVVDLIDELGGVDVNVEEPDFNTFNGRVCEQDSLRRKGENIICMDTGMQHLNGEQALAYSRCRHLYLLSDIDRNKHQQDLLEATAKELKNIDSLDKVKSILKVVSSNINSNMTDDQILSFYDVLKSMISNNNETGSFINVKKTYLEFYNLDVYLPAYHMNTSALGYYESSLDAIVDLMKVNLGLKTKERDKTFSYDSKNDYTPKPVGKGLMDNNKLELLPDFTGDSEGEVRQWCEKRGISVSTNLADSSEPIGTVVEQGLPSGVLVKNTKHLMIYVSNGKGLYNNSHENDEDIIIENYGESEEEED